MGERKTIRFQFGLKGLNTDTNPSLLTNGQYRSMSNLEPAQEGSISSRTGTRALGTTPTGTASCPMIRKMVVTPGEDPITPSVNPRYLISQASTVDLYRTPDYVTFTKVAAAVNTTNGQFTRAFSLATYSAGEVGGAWAFIAAELAMLKDSGLNPYATLHQWGILPAFGVASAVSDGASSGVLDGGAPLSPGQSQPYDWRFTYVAGDTNFEGNPSLVMLADSIAGFNRTGGNPSDGTNSGTPIIVHLESVTVTIFWTGDTQISSANIYRRGGLLYDTWRLVGTIPNPHTGDGSTSTFVDNISDEDLQFGQQITLDNDPPVDSLPQTPITGSFSGAITSGGFNIVNLSIGTLAKVTPGSLLHLFYDNPEDVIVMEIFSSTQFEAYFQHTHSSGADFEIDTIVAQPCSLAITYQQFVLVAGDPNNPHIIYRSKGGSPEAFPVVPADGSIATVACGTPSNPIINMCEFRGQILTLNLYGLFETLLLNGSFIPASQVAYRGLVSLRAWCKTDTEVWFLSTDGVWSWDGGTIRKRSQQIDPIFHGQEYEEFAPLSYAPSQLEQCVMETRRGLIYLLYNDIGGAFRELICDPMNGDRWKAASPANPTVIFLFTEPDTGSMIEARFNPNPNIGFQVADQVAVSSGVNYTSDGFTPNPPNPPTGGAAIPFDVRLPWLDLGSPQSDKDFEEIFLELDTTLSGGGSSLAVDILYDFSDTPDAADTATIVTTTAGRRLVSLLTALQLSSSTVQSYGREARAISIHLYGSAFPTRITFFSLVLTYQETAMLTAGGAMDWMDLGHPHDKRLYQMTVTFDTTGTNQQITLDVINGVRGNATFLQFQTFMLLNPVISGPGRAQCTFPLADGLIAKLVRVRPFATAAAVGDSSVIFFKIFSIEFPEMEKYPPDLVTATPWEDDGYAFNKYIQQATLDIDTGGVQIQVQIQTDNSGTVVTLPVTGTQQNRDQNLTVPPNIQGRKWRVFVDPNQAAIASGGGKAQIFNVGKIFRFQPADRGEVGHTFDADSLGHPFDKYLSVVTMEWDLSLAPSGASVVFQLDITNGIGGGTVVPNVAQFTLTGGRSKATFPIPANTIAKLIRLYPITSPLPFGFKNWKYEFKFIPYPPDIILSTEWKDASNPNDKNPSWLWIDADTQGIGASVSLQNENGTVFGVEHTGTATDRKFNYAIPVDIFAKMWRLLIVPGAGGKYQQFGYGFDRWQPTPLSSGIDPPDIVVWLPWNDFGWPYGSIAQNLTMTMDTNGVPCEVVLENEVGVQQIFSFTNTYDNRRTTLACTANLTGQTWRLLLTPGVGGKAKVWDWALEIVKLPPAVTFWTSNETGFGYRGWKYIKQIWLEYQCPSGISFTITSDTGTYTVNLPAHATRTTERFYPPTVWGSGLNKSKEYIFSFQSSGLCRMFADMSGIEWFACGADRHAAYQQTSLSEFMKLAI